MATPQKSLLIIFYRNPRLGAVKTRLASAVGNEEALKVFMRLAQHTRKVTEHLTIDKVVFYSESVDLMDLWPNSIYLKTLQEGDDLGERMANAFAAGFNSGYQNICIIGTDCFELTASMIERAYAELETSDAVIGPALDGGYYLLGLRKMHSQVFKNKAWSTETVLRDTLRDFESLGLTYVKLNTLRDVDKQEDLPDEWKE
jgi:hypothetical protein